MHSSVQNNSCLLNEKNNNNNNTSNNNNAMGPDVNTHTHNKQPSTIANHPYLQLIKPAHNNDSNRSFPPHPPLAMKQNSLPSMSSNYTPQYGHNNNNNNNPLNQNNNKKNDNHHNNSAIQKSPDNDIDPSTPTPTLSPLSSLPTTATSPKHPLPHSNLSNHTPVKSPQSQPILQYSHSLPPENNTNNQSINGSNNNSRNNHSQVNLSPSQNNDNLINNNNSTNYLNNNNNIINHLTNQQQQQQQQSYPHKLAQPTSSQLNNPNNNSSPSTLLNQSHNFDTRGHTNNNNNNTNLLLNFDLEDEAQDAHTELPTPPARRSTFTLSHSSGGSVQKLQQQPLGGAKSGLLSPTPSTSFSNSPFKTPTFTTLSPPRNDNIDDISISRSGSNGMLGIQLEDDDDDDDIDYHQDNNNRGNDNNNGTAMGLGSSNNFYKQHQQQNDPSTPPNNSISNGYNPNTVPLSPYGSQPRGSFSFGRHSFYSMHNNEDYEHDEDEESADCFMDAYSVRGCGDDDELV